MNILLFNFLLHPKFPCLNPVNGCAGMKYPVAN